MSKLNRILAVVLALQIVLLVVIYWPESSVASGRPLFEELEAEQVVELTISDVTGQEIRLAKGPEGWGLPEAGDFPVEKAKIEELLTQIAELKADRLVTRTADSHKRLQVANDDFERLIEFELKDGARHKLFLGSAPRFNVLHVRADDKDDVYLTLGLTVSDAGITASSWINPLYFSVPQQDIVRLTLENKNGRFDFERDEAGTWTMINLPGGETLLENNVSSLVTRISSVRMTRPLGQEGEASFGLNDPSAKATIVTRDEDGNEQTYVLRVGATPESENGYVVKSATSPYYVLVAEFAVQDLMERTMQDFIEVPPTPAATPGGQVGEPTPTPAQ